MKRLSLVAAAFAAAFASSAQAESTAYPLTLENCGRAITFEKAPGRVVSVGQNSTEILLSLGLAEKMVGTAVWFTPVIPEFEAANAKIPRLADNDPSFESVVKQTPELVTAQYEWHIGSNGSVGNRDQFAELGIPTYIAPADCVAKDNSGGGDGVRKEMFTMALVYREILDLAKIFDVNDRGEALVATLKQREADAIALTAGAAAKNVTMAFWFSSPKLPGDSYIAGINGAPGYIMKILGAKNVIDLKDEWPLVSWERVTGANPTVIVAGEMSRRRYQADSAESKLNFLKTDPVASKMESVQKNRIIVLDVQSMEPGIRAIDGIEQVAKGLSDFGLSD